MEKKYQVFVSSTFEDLKEERKAVFDTLIEMNCFPVGMENFPTCNRTQMDYIMEKIQECDIYILILAGKYGSIASNGLSFTENEYDYAKSINKPMICILHKDFNLLSKDKIEKGARKKELLRNFYDKVKKELVKFYLDKKEIQKAVCTSIYHLLMGCNQRTIFSNFPTASNIAFEFKDDLSNKDIQHYLYYTNYGESIYVEKITFFAKDTLICDVFAEKMFKNDDSDSIPLQYNDEAEPIMYHILKRECKELTAIITTRGKGELRVKVDVSNLYELQKLRQS